MIVLTFNIRYPSPADGRHAWWLRRERVADLLRRLQPDVAGLQEVMPAQRTFLEHALPEYAFLGVGRDADGGGEQCCLLFKRDLQVEDHGTFWLSPQSERPGSVGWDAALPRICTWAKLQDLWVMNAHLDHLGERARANAARQILDRLPAGPGVLMGDFNATDGDEPVEILKTRLKDAWIEARPGEPPPPTWHGFEAIEDAPRIDFIWTTPDLRATACEVVQERPCASDHDPVVAVVEDLAP